MLIFLVYKKKIKKKKLTGCDGSLQSVEDNS